MTIEHEEAVRLAEKHGASISGYPAYGQPLYAVIEVSGLAALIAEVRRRAMEECVLVATEREALFDECGKNSEATGCHVVKCCIRARLEEGK